MSEEHEAPEDNADVEAQAREVGWVPKDEYKGDEKYWKPAGVWLEQSPKRYIPQLEKKLGKLEGQITRERAEFADRLKRLEGTTSAALKRHKDEMERKYEEKILKATEVGDTDAVKKAMTDQKRELGELTEKAEVAEEKAKGGNEDIPPELLEWASENEWFKTNGRLHRRALSIWDDVDGEMPAAPLKTKLAEVKKRVEKAFPKEFGVEAGGEEEEDTDRKPSRVESGARHSGNGARAKGWSDIPADDRKIADRQIEQKLFKDRADFTKEYFAELEA